MRANARAFAVPPSPLAVVLLAAALARHANPT